MIKILILVPAYNESGQIANVLKDLKMHGYSNILVVDDGSDDNTAKIARESAKWVLSHVQNRGLGAALGTGFEFAKRFSPNILVTFDSDGQHQASDIQKIIRPIVNNQTDVVIGSRFADLRKAPIARQVLNYISNCITYIIYGVNTSDSLSGLRAFNQKAYRSSRTT